MRHFYQDAERRFGAKKMARAGTAGRWDFGGIKDEKEYEKYKGIRVRIVKKVN